MSDMTLTGQTWVAFGPAGAVGSVHRVGGGFTFKLLTDDDFRAVYPTLEAAQGALYAALLPGSEWPEFREH
ncbi:MAG: methyltransferase [Salinibacterium sp.]|nr:methyltransferase [Salinibacterium sp.]